MALFSSLGRYTATGLFIMRVGLGVMMIIHGLDKVTGGPDTWAKLGESMSNLHITFWPTFWGFMSAITETVGGLFCILGLWFRLVCMLLTFNFIVASAHHFAAGDGVKAASHALELCFVFAGLIFLGPGRYSVDKG
jgi:putative oxidoreductase